MDHAPSRPPIRTRAYQVVSEADTPSGKAFDAAVIEHPVRRR